MIEDTTRVQETLGTCPGIRNENVITAALLFADSVELLSEVYVPVLFHSFGAG